MLVEGERQIRATKGGGAYRLIVKGGGANRLLVKGEGHTG